VNLAIAFAEAGRSVLLIDGDLRRPKLADYLGVEGGVGLTNVLAHQVDVHDVIQTWGRTLLDVLPSGSVPPNPSELLGSRQMLDLITEMRTKYDMVIIDTPPLLPVTDAAVVSAFVDGTVIVVRYGRTKKKLVEIAVDNLRAVDARILGAVFNFSPTRGADAERAHGAYAYYSQSNTRQGVSRWWRRSRRGAEPALAGTTPGSTVRPADVPVSRSVARTAPSTAEQRAASAVAVEPVVATPSGSIAAAHGKAGERNPT
jgi:capsular exopolysaccharide synthesis family protein